MVQTKERAKAKTFTKTGPAARLEADKMLQQYELEKLKKQAAADGMKALEEQLHEMAENNPDWFKGQTAAFEHGKLRFVNSTKVQEPDEFDIDAFGADFPECVKKSLVAGKVKSAFDNKFSAARLKEFKVELVEEVSFKVEV